MHHSPHLSIRLLGSCQITRAGTAVTAFESDKGRALLVYLALEAASRSHSRDALVALLWPDTERRQARRSLRQVLYNLRQVLEQEGQGEPYLIASRHAIQFNQASDNWLDVAEFRRCLQAAAAHEHQQLLTCTTCMQRLAQAEALYGGEFLKGFAAIDSQPFEEWRRNQREELHRQALHVLSTLASHHERRHEYEQAARYLQRSLELEPWSEGTHRRLMQTLAWQGRRSAALKQYELCRQALQEALNAEPSAETRRLYEQIKAGSLAPPLIQATNPYKGLYAFAEEDASDFFGREAFVEKLVEEVHRSPAVVVIGPSGSGKTSVMQAGLLPRLRQELADSGPGARSWLVCELRLGSQPLQVLAETLGSLLPAGSDAAELTAGLLAGKRTLDDIAAEILQARRPGEDPVPDLGSLHSDQRRLLVLIDPFEELFTQCTDASVRRTFLDVLFGPAAETAGDAPGPVTLVLGLRADFVGQALARRSLAAAIQDHGLLLGPMNRQELRQAIVEPARHHGIRFQPGLVERLLDDVGEDAGNLPLLQFALSQLWLKRQPGLADRAGLSVLLHAAYEEIGGVVGTVTTYAERLYQRQATDAARARFQEVLLRMVHLGPGIEPTRRVLLRSDVDEEDWLLVQQLADARLVVANRDAEGRETAELAHEALIHSWRRLHSWIEADRAYFGWQQRLQAALLQWQLNEFDEGALLRGAPLAEAEGWLAARPQYLSAAERSFITASIALQAREQTLVAMRQQRELEQAQIVAQMERERAEAEHRRADMESAAGRRLRWAIGGLAVALVLAVAAFAIAFIQSQEARRQTEVALRARSNALAASERAEYQAQLSLSRQLAAQAVNMVRSEIDLALLLSVEALRLPHTPADAAYLFSALRFNPMVKRVLHDHQGAVYHLVFEADGQHLLAATQNGLITRWAVFGSDIDSIDLDGVHEETLARLDSRGERVALLDGPEITVWDLRTRQPVSPPFRNHAADVRSQSFFTAGEDLFFSTDAAGVSLLWRLASGAELGRFLLKPIGELRAVSPQGDRAVLAEVVEGELLLYLWDLHQDRQVGAPMAGHSATIHSVAFSPDGALIATASFDGSVRLWDAHTGQPVGPSLEGHEGRVLSAAFSPDGRLLATGGTDNRVFLWDPQRGRMAGMPLTGHSNWVRSLAFSPDGSILAAGDENGKVVLWDVGARRLLTGHSDRVRAVVVSPDGRALVTSSFDRTLRRWDAITGVSLGSIATPHATSIIQMALSADGRRLATGDTSGVIVVWDAVTLQPQHILVDGHDNVVVALAFHPDSRRLAAGDFDGTICLWDVETGTRIGSVQQAHAGWTLSLAFSPDGALLASGGSDSAIRLWDAATLAPTGVAFSGHTGWVTSLVFDASGSTLVSGSADHSIRMWDLVGATGGSPLLGHEAQVWSVQFDPADASGRTLISLGADGSVVWWDTENGTPIAPPLFIGQETETMAVSPDGNTLYFGAFEPTAIMWRLTGANWAERACAIANRNLNPEEWQRYLSDAPYRPTCAFSSAR